MVLHLKIIGTLFIVLGAVHVAFPRYFNWKSEFAGLSLINRQMMYVHTLFIALTVVLMGALCLTSAEEMIHTGIGKKITLGLAIFWGARLLIQLFGYSGKLWKGKPFETVIHVVFVFFWTYVSTVFILAYIQ